MIAEAFRNEALGLELVRLCDDGGDPAALDRVSHAVWPEFLFHTAAIKRGWQRLLQRFPECQLAIRDGASGALVGVANTVPFRLGGGDLADRQDGWDGVLAAATAHDAPQPDTLSALGVVILPEHRRPGAADFVLDAMKALACERGFPELVAPVRPTLKHRYPLTDFERYVGWRRPDGSPFDPWVRKHVQLGGAVVAPCHRSMRVEAGVADWEEWTGMALPESGRYVVAGALVPVDVDRERDRARYLEPNLWIRHAVSARQGRRNPDRREVTS